MQYQTGDGHRRKQRRVLIAHELDTPEDHPERKRLLPSHKFEFAVGHLFGNMFRSCEVPFLIYYPSEDFAAPVAALSSRTTTKVDRFPYRLTTNFLRVVCLSVGDAV